MNSTEAMMNGNMHGAQAEPARLSTCDAGRYELHRPPPGSRPWRSGVLSRSMSPAGHGASRLPAEGPRALGSLSEGTLTDTSSEAAAIGGSAAVARRDHRPRLPGRGPRTHHHRPRC